MNILRKELVTLQKLLNTREIAEYLNVSETTIVRWRRSGLPYKKIGYNTCRYDISEVKKWMNEKEGTE